MACISKAIINHSKHFSLQLIFSSIYTRRNLGLGILLEDTSECRLEPPRIEPQTLWLADDLLHPWDCLLREEKHYKNAVHNLYWPEPLTVSTHLLQLNGKQ